MTSPSVPLRVLGVCFKCLLAGSAIAAALVVLGRELFAPGLPPTPPLKPLSGRNTAAGPRLLSSGKRLTVWWDDLPADLRARVVPSGAESNVHPSDYVGPETCKHCHKQNYDSWSQHPHRWMNALADRSTVKGDFSGATLSYRGGRATFSREGGACRMRLERGRVRRTYAVTQTIGSRFFQYYVGKQLEGPEPPGHHFYAKDHVLPFGYWLDQKEWVPIVHIGPELPDELRPDPFTPPDRGKYYAEYAVSCNPCHTTFPLGDLFGRTPGRIGEYAPLRLHWAELPYLKQAHPDVARSAVELTKRGAGMDNPLAGWDAPHYAATLGISCEACHLGAREHVASGGRVLPKFFPASPHLSVETGGAALDFGRTHDNVNWACGRCHVGGRPRFAAGMSTWNSVEYSDAMLGSCYSKLRCVDCHNPHRAIGPRWTPSPEQDDARCLKCHDKLAPAPQRLAHTHHPAGSAGARCMNCHMPRINEGLQDTVRTHMIYSPTRADMLEANHPNACNLCHTDRPIDWTLGRLKEWYGKSYDEGKIAANYPHRGRPAAQGWLKSDSAAVRLVAAAALTRARDRPAVPQLLEALDDPYLVNRQFASRGIEELLNVRLADFGYRFYMSSAERRGPLAGLRTRFSPTGAAKTP